MFRKHPMVLGSSNSDPATPWKVREACAVEILDGFRDFFAGMDPILPISAFVPVTGGIRLSAEHETSMSTVAASKGDIGKYVRVSLKVQISPKIWAKVVRDISPASLSSIPNFAKQMSSTESPHLVVGFWVQNWTVDCPVARKHGIRGLHPHNSTPKLQTRDPDDFPMTLKSRIGGVVSQNWRLSMEVVLVQSQRWRFLLVILINHPSSQIIVPEVLSTSGLQSSLPMASRSCQQLPCWHVTLSMWRIFLKIQPKHQRKPPQNSMSPHFRGSSSKHVQNSPMFPALDGICWVQCRKKMIYIYIWCYESKPWDPTVGTLRSFWYVDGDSPSHMPMVGHDPWTEPLRLGVPATTLGQSRRAPAFCHVSGMKIVHQDTLQR